MFFTEQLRTTASEMTSLFIAIARAKVSTELRVCFLGIFHIASTIN